MTNKKSQRNQRGNRKHRTLRGGGLFDGLIGNPTTGSEQPVPSSEPKKGWFDGLWPFGKKTDTTMTTNPVTEKKTDALNAAVTGSATGGKRRNKTEKNKNKNRKNKH